MARVVLGFSKGVHPDARNMGRLGLYSSTSNHAAAENIYRVELVVIPYGRLSVR